MTRNTTTPIHPQFLGRMSPRAFKPEALSQAQIEQLADAARWAPSASNKQPWHFAYALRGDANWQRSEEHTSELQSRLHLVCRLLLETKKMRAHAENHHRHQRAPTDVVPCAGIHNSHVRHQSSRLHASALYIC